METISNKKKKGTVQTKWDTSLGYHLTQMTICCFELEGKYKLVLSIQILYRPNASRIEGGWEIMEIITKNLQGNMEPEHWRWMTSNRHKKGNCGGNMWRYCRKNDTQWLNNSNGGTGEIR